MSLSNDQASSLYSLAGKVFRSLRGIMHSISRDDAIQAAMIYCVKNADNWDSSRSSFNTYFSMVCRHSMIQANRSEKSALARLSGPSLSYTHENSHSGRATAEKYLSHEEDNGVDSRDEYEEVSKVISGLSGHQQKTLSDLMGMGSVKSIASLRGCSQQAISKSRSAAIHNIRRLWFRRASSDTN